MVNPFNNSLPNQVSAVLDLLDNKPKIVQCTQLLNEETLAEAAILQIYNKVNRIVILEGAVENKVKLGQATSDGHSVDGTVEVIKRVIKEKDPENKIIFIQIERPWKNLEEMKGAFFNYMTEGDYALILDADEFIQPETVDLLRRAIELEPYATEFVPMFFHFWKDRRFIRNPAKLGFGVQHQRFFKFQPGMYYQHHPVVRDKNNICTYFDPRYLGRRFVLPNFNIFHYSYMNFKTKDILEKTDFYNKELAGKDAGSKERMEIDRQFREYTECHDDLVTCDLDHPEIIKAASWFNVLDSKLSQNKFKSYKEIEPYSLDNPQLIWAWRNKEGYNKLFNEVNI